MTEKKQPNFAIFVSGRGSNMEAIIKKVKSGYIPANLAVVVSDQEDAKAREIASKAGIKEVCVPLDMTIQSPKERRAEHEARILPVMKENNIDFIILAGYMRIIKCSLFKEYKDRIINIHPSLLPDFPGEHGYKDTFYSVPKRTEGGCTIHFIDNGVDTGPIIIQGKVPIFGNDTFEDFAARGLKKEHELYSQVIRKYVKGKIIINENRTVMIKV